MYKASALYVVSDDKIFSPLYSGNPIGSILLSVGSRVLFGFVIGYLFSIIKGRRYEKIGIWILSLISQWIHAFLVFTVMEPVFHSLAILECQHFIWESMMHLLHYVVFSG